VKSEERGRIVARVLAGSWRSDPPPLDLIPQELEEISSLLLRQSSGGLAWHRIRGSALADQASAAPLRETYRYQTLRVRLLERQLRETIARLRDHGIEPILAKGWALGRLYPEAGLRPYGDLDLLVLPFQYQKARAALTGPGVPPAPVELHTDFPMLGDRCAERLFEKSRLVPFEGTSIRILGPEDQLRLATLHGLNHGLCRPLWLCDVAVALEAISSEFDWRYALWGDPWLSEGVLSGILLAGTVLGVDLEKAGIPELRQDAEPPPWMASAALRAFGARQHYMDLPDPGELLLHPSAFLKATRLRWANALEVAYRRRASWSRGPGLPLQLLDYLARSGGFLTRVPGVLLDEARGRWRREPEASGQLPWDEPDGTG